MEAGKRKLESCSFPTYDIRPTTYPVVQFVLWQTSPELAKIDGAFQ